MFTLFLNPFGHKTDFAELIPGRDELQRLHEMQEHEHHSPESLDILDRVHARLLNRSQYKIEHDGLAYWCNEQFQLYNPYTQANSQYSFIYT